MKRLRAIWQLRTVEITCAWCFAIMETFTHEETKHVGSANLRCKNCNGINVLPNDLLRQVEHAKDTIDPDNPPGRASQFDSIVGNVVLKRAIEVALVGHLTFCYVGDPLTAWPQVQAILGERAMIMQKCPCGNFMSPERVCTCTLEEIKAHRTNRKFVEALLHNMIVEAVTPRAEEFFTQYEPYLNVVERIRKVRFQQEFWRAGMDVRPRHNPAFDLLNMARIRLGLTTHMLGSIQRVAMTLAEMEGQQTVQPTHMAEAIQYRTPLLYT